jgi:hypothetical protein
MLTNESPTPSSFANQLCVAFLIKRASLIPYEEFFLRPWEINRLRISLDGTTTAAQARCGLDSIYFSPQCLGMHVWNVGE